MKKKIPSRFISFTGGTQESESIGLQAESDRQGKLARVGVKTLGLG